MRRKLLCLMHIGLTCWIALLMAWVALATAGQLCYTYFYCSLSQEYVVEVELNRVGISLAVAKWHDNSVGHYPPNFARVERWTPAIRDEGYNWLRKETVMKDFFYAGKVLPNLHYANGLLLIAWNPSLLAAVLITSVLILYQRYRKSSVSLDGICEKCGYNLTGNASGKCPECGRSTGSE